MMGEGSPTGAASEASEQRAVMLSTADVPASDMDPRSAAKELRTLLQAGKEKPGRASERVFILQWAMGLPAEDWDGLAGPRTQAHMRDLLVMAQPPQPAPAPAPRAPRAERAAPVPTEGVPAHLRRLAAQALLARHAGGHLKRALPSTKLLQKLIGAAPSGLADPASLELARQVQESLPPPSGPQPDARASAKTLLDRLQRGQERENVPSATVLQLQYGMGMVPTDWDGIAGPKTKTHARALLKPPAPLPGVPPVIAPAPVPPVPPTVAPRPMGPPPPVVSAAMARDAAIELLAKMRAGKIEPRVKSLDAQRLQVAMGMPLEKADGYAGPNTQTWMWTILGTPSGYDPARARKSAKQMARHLAELGPDRYSHPGLREWQTWAGLAPDGLYGGQTRAALMAMGTLPPKAFVRPVTARYIAPPAP